MAATDHLASRYGRTREHTRRVRAAVIAAAVLLVAAFTVWITWVTVLTAPTSIGADTNTSRVLNDRLVDVSFTVDTAVGNAVACAVQATDSDKTIVGWKVVAFAPSERRMNAYTVRLRTIQPATSGLISSCWVT